MRIPELLHIRHERIAERAVGKEVSVFIRAPGAEVDFINIDRLAPPIGFARLLPPGSIRPGKAA